MAPRSWRRMAAVLPGLLLAGCFDEPPLPDSGVPVFSDTFTDGVTPFAFDTSVLTALSVDRSKAREGSASIRLDVPPVSAGYAGGAVLATTGQDVSGQDALVFWATASRATAFDELGFGLDFDSPPAPLYPYRASVAGLPLTTAWTRHLVPIPDPARLTALKGMLYYVDTDPGGVTVWLDGVKYDRLGEATINLTPSIATASRNLQPGGTAPVPGVAIRYTDFDGSERSLDSFGPGSGPARAWFQFVSSNPAAATVDGAGQVTALAIGQAEITARLRGTTVPGAFTVNVVGSLPTAPTTAPPAPTAAAADVISLFSGAYTDVPVDTWRTSWSQATLTEVTVAGDPMKRYSALDFVGVETFGTPVDASAMTRFHVDVWTPDATTFRVKLVDLGADGVIGGTGDSEHEVVFDAGSSPALTTGGWVSLDIPLTAFANLAGRAHLGQLIFSAVPAGGATVFVDNVYLRR